MVIAVFAGITTNLSGDYICGDANGDGGVNVSDAVHIVNFVFVGGDAPDPVATGDCNCDGSCNVSDAVAVINFVFVGGYDPCDPDDDGIPECDPNSPMAIIDPSPDLLEAPWSLTGPEGFSASGNGDDTLISLEVGEYTITWGDVFAWVTPPDSTHILASEDTVTFSGIYVEAGPGTIVIDPAPDSLNAAWSLTGPEGYLADGNGDDTLAELDPGDYTITWGYVFEWIKPQDSTLTLPPEDTMTFIGTYVEAIDSTGTVTDIDGNVYQTIKIGDKWWMMENLKVTHYRNGDEIPNITSNSTWENLISGAYCNYDNDEGNVDTYGRLYNWHAVSDSRGIAPQGWHVPTDAEWKQLEMYLGMTRAEADASGWRGTAEGGMLKDTGTTYWASPNGGATNESGFTALPGAYRNYDGSFNNLGNVASFWTATQYSSDRSWTRRLHYQFTQCARLNYGKTYGSSIRCVKDY
jgi:uncharacterized protein (TIGR02145 family)